MGGWDTRATWGLAFHGKKHYISEKYHTMSDTSTTKRLYGLYAQRFGSCPRTPYQAEFYKAWLELLNSCETNEEAEEKSKQNGLYTGGAAAVAMDRIFANKQAAEKLGWADVASFCEDLIQKIKADPYYTFTHTGMWADLQGVKSGWLRTIEGFHKLFIDFLEYDDTRNDPDKAMSAIQTDLKMLSKPSADFAKLAAMPQFRALIDCSDEYYAEFTGTIGKAIATGKLEKIEWSTKPWKDQIEQLWNDRNTLKPECDQWYGQAVKPCVVRLSPESPEGKYEFVEID